MFVILYLIYGNYYPCLFSACLSHLLSCQPLSPSHRTLLMLGALELSPSPLLAYCTHGSAVSFLPPHCTGLHHHHYVVLMLSLVLFTCFSLSHMTQTLVHSSHFSCLLVGLFFCLSFFPVHTFASIMLVSQLLLLALVKLSLIILVILPMPFLSSCLLLH